MGRLDAVAAFHRGNREDGGLGLARRSDLPIHNLHRNGIFRDVKFLQPTVESEFSILIHNQILTAPVRLGAGHLDKELILVTRVISAGFILVRHRHGDGDGLGGVVAGIGFGGQGDGRLTGLHGRHETVLVHRGHLGIGRSIADGQALHGRLAVQHLRHDIRRLADFKFKLLVGRIGHGNHRGLFLLAHAGDLHRNLETAALIIRLGIGRRVHGDHRLAVADRGDHHILAVHLGRRHGGIRRDGRDGAVLRAGQDFGEAVAVDAQADGRHGRGARVDDERLFRGVGTAVGDGDHGLLGVRILFSAPADAGIDPHAETAVHVLSLVKGTDQVGTAVHADRDGGEGQLPGHVLLLEGEVQLAGIRYQHEIHPHPPVGRHTVLRGIFAEGRGGDGIVGENQVSTIGARLPGEEVEGGRGRLDGHGGGERLLARGHVVRGHEDVDLREGALEGHVVTGDRGLDVHGGPERIQGRVVGLEILLVGEGGPVAVREVQDIGIILLDEEDDLVVLALGQGDRDAGLASAHGGRRVIARAADLGRGDQRAVGGEHRRKDLVDGGAVVQGGGHGCVRLAQGETQVQVEGDGHGGAAQGRVCDAGRFLDTGRHQRHHRGDRQQGME